MDGAANPSAANPSAAARRLLMAAAGLAMLQAGPGITALGPVRRTLSARLSGRGAADHVALTFDHGPDPALTPQFLELLDTRQVRATFFLLGSMTARAPELAAQIAATGHEIGVHGWDHRYLPLRGPRATYDDIRRARDTIASVTGATPRFFRPPYGVLSSSGLAAARRLGLTPVLWTCWGKEWRPGSTPESVYASLASGLACAEPRCYCMTRTARRRPASPRRWRPWTRRQCCSMTAVSGDCGSARSVRTPSGNHPVENMGELAVPEPGEYAAE